MDTSDPDNDGGDGAEDGDDSSEDDSDGDDGAGAGGAAIAAEALEESVPSTESLSTAPHSGLDCFLCSKPGTYYFKCSNCENIQNTAAGLSACCPAQEWGRGRRVLCSQHSSEQCPGCKTQIRTEDLQLITDRTVLSEAPSTPQASEPVHSCPAVPPDSEAPYHRDSDSL